MQRDAEIPRYRQLIKEAIEQDLKDSIRLLSLSFTVVQLAIMIPIIIQTSIFASLLRKRNLKIIVRKENGLQKWGNVLFFEDVPYSNYNTAHYDQFVKVDTFYYQLKDVLPSIWLRNIEALFDESEMLEDVVEKSWKLTFEPTCEDVEYWRTKFFAYLHETYRRAMRGEIYYALNCLDKLRFFMATAWYMEAGIQPNA